MKSRFTFKSYFILLLTTISLGITVFLISTFYLLKEDERIGQLIVFPFPIFVFAWLFFGELRNKMIKFRFDDESIIINKFAGFSIDEVYKLSEIQGFIISDLPYNHGSYEYLYCIKNKNKIVKLSEFYHANYDELKEEVQSKIKYLGREEFSYIEEFKEMFSK